MFGFLKLSNTEPWRLKQRRRVQKINRQREKMYKVREELAKETRENLRAISICRNLK